MKRRNFIKTATAISAAIPAFSNNIFAETKSDNSKELDLIAIYGATAKEMYEKGIAEMGGMERFVKKGQTVVLKPNIGWDRTPEYGSNTDPELVGAITRDCFKAGAKEVFCYDHTCGNNWETRYEVSGIKAEVEKYGGKMIAGNSQNMFEEQDIPKGIVLKKTKVHKFAINPDVFINIPVLKHHSGAKITCAMKNYMGCIWDRKEWHKKGMPDCIADYCTYQKTDLTIVDAYRVMLDHGPRGKSPEFAPVAKYQVISTDIVAADTAAVGIFSSVVKQFGMGTVRSVADIPYITKGEELGVGTTDLSKLNMKKISMA